MALVFCLGMSNYNFTLLRSMFIFYLFLQKRRWGEREKAIDKVLPYTASFFKCTQQPWPGQAQSQKPGTGSRLPIVGQIPRPFSHCLLPLTVHTIRALHLEESWDFKLSNLILDVVISSIMLTIHPSIFSLLHLKLQIPLTNNSLTILTGRTSRRLI